jgi:hypothetical protein
MISTLGRSAAFKEMRAKDAKRAGYNRVFIPDF